VPGVPDLGFPPVHKPDVILYTPCAPRSATPLQYSSSSESWSPASLSLPWRSFLYLNLSRSWTHFSAPVPPPIFPSPTGDDLFSRTPRPCCGSPGAWSPFLLRLLENPRRPTWERRSSSSLSRLWSFARTSRLRRPPYRIMFLSRFYSSNLSF